MPPHSVEAEQSVLGGLLLDNSAWDRVGGVLADRDFYRYEHRLIYAGIGALINAGKPADVITVAEQLQRKDKAEECGGLVYLNALAQSVPSASNIGAYARIVHERALLRALATIASDLADQAMQGQTAVEAIIDAAIMRLLAMQERERSSEPKALEELVPAFVDALNDRAEGKNDGIATGLRALDRLASGGGRSGELWVIGARPSMGKTAMVLHLGRHVGERFGVLMMTQEDSNQSLLARHVAAAGRVNLSNIRNPQGAPDAMWSGVSEAIDRLSKLRLYFDDQAGLTLMDVRRKIQQVKRRDPDLRLVIVDYLQLMEGQGDNRNQMLGQISNGLKKAAKEFGTWIVLLSQLNREADKRSGVPQMADLRDSGDIEGAADVIGLLYREWRRKPTEENKHWAQLHIAKHKNGPTDTLNLWFDGETQCFGDWDGPAPRAGMQTAGGD